MTQMNADLNPLIPNATVMAGRNSRPSIERRRRWLRIALSDRVQWVAGTSAGDDGRGWGTAGRRPTPDAFRVSALPIKGREGIKWGGIL